MMRQWPWTSKFHDIHISHGMLSEGDHHLQYEQHTLLLQSTTQMQQTTFWTSFKLVTYHISSFFHTPLYVKIHLGLTIWTAQRKRHPSSLSGTVTSFSYGSMRQQASQHNRWYGSPQGLTRMILCRHWEQSWWVSSSFFQNSSRYMALTTNISKTAWIQSISECW